MSLPFYRFLHGNLVIRAKQPDGDSVRFVADLPEPYRDLRYARRIRPSQEDDTVQLRLEGIDAPEVHYGPFAQPYGDVSREAFLAMLGFSDVVYEAGEKNRVESATPDSVPVTVATHAADANGRVVSYLLPRQDLADGAEGRLDENMLHASFNYRMLETGHAYYMAYTSTPRLHQDVCREAAIAARKARLGVWSLDRTQEWVLSEQADVGRNGQLIFPKLFRRCCDYLADRRGGFKGDLADWLVNTRQGHARDEDDRVVLEGRFETRLSELIQQRNSRVTLQVDLLDLAFVEH